MKKKPTYSKASKAPTIISKVKPKGPAPTRTIPPLPMQHDVKALESQGLQAIQLLKDMDMMLDTQISNVPGAPRSSDQFEKFHKKESEREGRALKDIQAKNKQIRSILDDMNGGGESDKGYGQLLELEAVFGNSKADELSPKLFKLH